MGMNGMDGKGNIMVGIDWTKRDPVFQRDRDFYVKGWTDPGNPSGGFTVPPAYSPGSNTPSQAALNAIFPGGNVGPSTQINFNADGTAYINAGGLGYNGPLNSLAPGRYSAMKLLGPNTSSPNTLDQAATGNLASIPLERHSLFGRGTFNFTDDLSMFTQVSYNNVKVKTASFGYPPAITIWQATIPRYNSATAGSPQDSTWLPPELLSLLNSRTVNPNAPAGTTGPNAPWNLYQVQDYTGYEVATNVSDVWQALAGLKGKMPFHDWTWEVYASRGNTHIQADYTGMNSLQRYQYMVAQPNFGKGLVNSSPAGTPFGYGVSCTSGIPVFQHIPATLVQTSQQVFDRADST